MSLCNQVTCNVTCRATCKVMCKVHTTGCHSNTMHIMILSWIIQYNTMFPESCEVEEPYYLVKETGSVEMVFTLPTDSTFKNISRGGVKVDHTVVNATTYKVVLSGVKISDAGEYVMYHEIAEHTLNCTTFLSVPVYSPPKASISSVAFYVSFESSVKDIEQEKFKNLMSAQYWLVYNKNEEYLNYRGTQSDILLHGNYGIPDTVRIAYTDEYEALLPTVILSVKPPATCNDKIKSCNGIFDCGDSFDDEIGCGKKGDFAKVAVGGIVNIPYIKDTFTICFYSFGDSYIKDSHGNSTKTGLGYTCAVISPESGEIQTYHWDETEFKQLNEGTITPLIHIESGFIKNVIIFEKGLSEEEMKEYETKCPTDSYPSSILYDHHFLISYNVELGTDYDYKVVPDVCNDQALPTEEISIADNYICKSGTVLQNHCNTAKCGGSDEECDYYDSAVVAATQETCSISRSRPSNDVYNNLTTLARNSYLDRCGTSCGLAFLDSIIMGDGSKYSWSNNDLIKNQKFKTEPKDAESFEVSIDKNGFWGLETPPLPDNSVRICDVTKQGSTTGYLNFGDDNYSEIKIKSTSLSRLTACFDVDGKGAVLQYNGSATISPKDIFISIEKTEQGMIVVVFVAGFPEYFHLRDAEIRTYVCFRWEKSTGRTNLAANGKWYDGENKYAKNRKITLPREGTLTVGRDVDGKTSSFKGKIYNLIIFEQFFSPNILLETSRKYSCSDKIKTDGWLTFEQIIAGISDISMLKNDACGEIPHKRNLPIDPETVGESKSFTITFKYPDDVISPGIIIPKDTDRLINTKNYLMIRPQNSFCIPIPSASDYIFSVKAVLPNYVMGVYGVGKETGTVFLPEDSEDSMYQFVVDNVSGDKDNRICIKNLLSTSDSSPTDGLLQEIRISRGIKAVCKAGITPDANRGDVSWPAAVEPGMQYQLCPYGGGDLAAAYASRNCKDSGYEEGADYDDCGEEYQISTDDAKDYFNRTELSDDTVEEYTNTINQVVAGDEVNTAQLDIAAEALNKIAEAESVDIKEETMKTVVEVADSINSKLDQTDETKTDNSSSTVIKAVANLVGRIEIEEGGTFSATTPSVSVAAYRPPEDAPEEDLFATFTENEEGSGTDITVGSRDATQDGSSRIIIPSTVVEGKKSRVWFTLYRENSTLFNTSSNPFNKSGPVLGAGIGTNKMTSGNGTDKMTQLKSPVTLTFKTNVINKRAICQYYDMTKETPVWSKEGMKLLSKTANNITCNTSHLTNFAILVNPSDTQFTQNQNTVLEILTIGGCTLSIIGLTITVVGLTAFKKIRSAITNKVHIGLSVSLIMSYILLLIGLPQKDYQGVCYTFSILIHLCFLSAFCWMVCEAVNLYLRLVVVFSNSSNVFLKFSIFSTAVPAIIVLLTIIIEFGTDKPAYIVSEAASGTDLYCWLSYDARMAAFMVPLLLMLCCNFVVFFLVMRVLFANKKGDRSQWLPRLRSAIAVSTLMGLTWVVGIFAIGEASFAVNIIFTLLSSCQGVLIAYLYCFAKSDVVTHWKNSFRSSFSKSSTDKSGLSMTASAVQPKSTVSTGFDSKTATGNWKGNVYSNAVSEDNEERDYSCSEDNHIYDEFDPAGDQVALQSPSDGTLSPEEKTKREFKLRSNLKGVVKEKVETYEEISQNVKDSTIPGAGNKLAPDGMENDGHSFQIRSGSVISEDSNIKL